MFQARGWNECLRNGLLQHCEALHGFTAAWVQGFAGDPQNRQRFVVEPWRRERTADVQTVEDENIYCGARVCILLIRVLVAVTVVKDNYS